MRLPYSVHTFVLVLDYLQHSPELCHDKKYRICTATQHPFTISI